MKASLMDMWNKSRKDREDFIERTKIFFSIIQKVLESGAVDKNNHIEPNYKRFNYSNVLDANFKTTDLDSFVQIIEIVAGSLSRPVLIEDCDKDGYTDQDISTFETAGFSASIRYSDIDIYFMFEKKEETKSIEALYQKIYDALTGFGIEVI